MYARDKTSRAVPCWLIFDDRYRKRYAHLRSSPGRFPRKLLESGRLKQAWTLDDLARMCGIDAAGLAETVERFNAQRRAGRRPRLRAGRLRLQPGAGRSQPQGASLPRPDRRAARTTPSRSCPATSAPAAASSPTSTPGSSTRTTSPIDGPVRHRQHHRHGHGPPLPRARARASPTAWCSATSPRSMPRGEPQRRPPTAPTAGATDGRRARRQGRRRHRRGQRHRPRHRRALRRGGRPGRHRRHRRRGRRGRWPPRSATSPPSSGPTSPSPTTCRRSWTSPSSGSAAST